jgi:hypothetical protein
LMSFLHINQLIMLLRHSMRSGQIFVERSKGLTPTITLSNYLTCPHYKALPFLVAPMYLQCAILQMHICWCPLMSWIWSVLLLHPFPLTKALLLFVQRQPSICEAIWRGIWCQRKWALFESEMGQKPWYGLPLCLFQNWVDHITNQ